MMPGTVRIHLLPPEPRSIDAGWHLLSPHERVRAGSFAFPKHANRWISYRSALRRVLGKVINVPPGEVPIIISPLGKPVLAEPFEYLHFSISHCENLALFALCVDGAVGVDVEPASRSTELPETESSFCHPEEIEDLPHEPGARGRRLLDVWTAKEALLKALGTGQTHPAETVRIHRGDATSTATSDSPLPGIEGQVIHRLSHPALAEHNAAVSAPASVTRIKIHSPEPWTFGDFPPITLRRPREN